MTAATHASALLPLVLAGALAAGCSTMSVPLAPIQPIESYPLRQEMRQLTVAVHPVTSAQEIDATFKTDLLDRGIVPILVIIDNKHPSASFIVARVGVAVVHNETAARSAAALPAARSETGAQVATVVGAALISLPLVIGGMKFASDAQVIQHNLADKAFYSHTVAPGRRAQGYLYFDASNGKPLAGHHHVLVEVREAATRDPLRFVFPIPAATR
jgi:hypothetical protein